MTASERVSALRARLRGLGVPGEWLDSLPDAAVVDLAAGLDGGNGVVALPEFVLHRLRNAPGRPPRPGADRGTPG